MPVTTHHIRSFLWFDHQNCCSTSCLWPAWPTGTASSASSAAAAWRRSATLGPERFLREIEVAAHLQHPHILPLFDSGRVGDGSGFFYYVMPYVAEESLRARGEGDEVDCAEQAEEEPAADDVGRERGWHERKHRP
jgi:hypothetical protein